MPPVTATVAMSVVIFVLVCVLVRYAKLLADNDDKIADLAEKLWWQSSRSASLNEVVGSMRDELVRARDKHAAATEVCAEKAKRIRYLEQCVKTSEDQRLVAERAHQREQGVLKRRLGEAMARIDSLEVWRQGAIEKTERANKTNDLVDECMARMNAARVNNDPEAMLAAADQIASHMHDLTDKFTFTPTKKVLVRHPNEVVELMHTPEPDICFDQAAPERVA